jgi:hypothetical protein
MIVLEPILILAVTILQVTGGHYAALEILRYLWLPLCELEQVLILVCHKKHLWRIRSCRLAAQIARGVCLIAGANSFLLNDRVVGDLHARNDWLAWRWHKNGCRFP